MGQTLLAYFLAAQPCPVLLHPYLTYPIFLHRTVTPDCQTDRTKCGEHEPSYFPTLQHSTAQHLTVPTLTLPSHQDIGVFWWYPYSNPRTSILPSRSESGEEETVRRTKSQPPSPSNPPSLTRYPTPPSSLVPS